MTQDECTHKSGTYFEDGIERCSGCGNAMVTFESFSNHVQALLCGGVDLIAHERMRQKTEEGLTSEHDDTHNTGAMAMAAACYASPERLYVCRNNRKTIAFRDPWPWASCWDKRGASTRIRDLVRAGALIAAEIDRLQRLEQKVSGDDEGE
jgi:hypothetical protein